MHLNLKHVYHQLGIFYLILFSSATFGFECTYIRLDPRYAITLIIICIYYPFEVEMQSGLGVIRHHIAFIDLTDEQEHLE